MQRERMLHLDGFNSRFRLTNEDLQPNFCNEVSNIQRRHKSNCENNTNKSVSKRYSLLQH